MSAISPGRAQEIELKLTADAGFTAPALTGVGEVASVGNAEVFELDATYYDTDDLDLLRSRMTLRRRTGGKDGGWHLKLPGSGPGAGWTGTSGRTEFHFPLDDELPTDLISLVRGATRDRPLRPVTGIRTTRTVRELRDAAGTALVEFADDAVRTEVVGEPGKATRPEGAAEWRELEVELLSGPEDTVRLVAGRLAKAGATPAAQPSKLATALAAAGREPARAPAPTGLGRRSRASDVVLASLSRHRDALVLADVGLRVGSKEAVIASRSAIRRLRSTLDVYRPLFAGNRVDLVGRSLRTADRLLQQVRDNHHLDSWISAELAEEPTEFAQPATVLLNRALADRDAEAWQHVELWLQGRKAVRLITRLDDLISDPPLDPDFDGSAARLLPAQVAGSWQRVRRLAGLALADPENGDLLERVRRTARGVRYAAELAGTALGDDPVVFAAAVEEIQEVLGGRRAAVVVSDFLVELASDARTTGRAGFLFGRLHAAAGGSMVSSVDDFTDAWHRADEPDLTAWLR